MAGEVRGRMVAGAAQLLAQRGLQATSFSEVLELTGAPRGSVYHHFPEGKDQLVTAALDLVGARLLEAVDAQAGASAVDVTKAFLQVWRTVLERSKLSAGCAVLAVTVATDSDELLEHAAGVFGAWRSRLAELLQAGGLTTREARRFATTLVASAEGAVVLSRADQSMEPFELVSEQVLHQVRQMTAG
jgi:TetR/AcrR family transcriptional regulator, lmrAB and yxaGH operons repressor